ncbi:hypothetical protein SAY86_010252 [Trapa natans]|uniref:TCP domain-containing protein n=1 Tax=Trapa natans TaxID=22666 RepID=A0AAN7KXG2_TRANT|nr:hypothetical protein SAY86_010252 [Trapa natans]
MNTTKKERDQDQDQILLASSSSRRWSEFRNPRIVRVSRTFGGKDRHSKVCTVRGLRDRRIRLSVPTAVQLYDLQDKLGVSQPSKVIDWLIDVTKHEIDRLPPLRMLPGFGSFPLIPPELLGASWPSLAPFYDMSSPIFLKQLGKNAITMNEPWGGEDVDSMAMRSKGKEIESRQGSPHPQPSVPRRASFIPVLPNTSSHRLTPQNDHSGPFENHAGGIASSLSLAPVSNPLYYTPPSHQITPQNFPPYNNGTPHHPLAAESNLQLINTGQSFGTPRHLFGAITSRPVFSEYFKLVLCPENKAGNLPSI